MGGTVSYAHSSSLLKGGLLTIYMAKEGDGHALFFFLRTSDSSEGHSFIHIWGDVVRT